MGATRRAGWLKGLLLAGSLAAAFGVVEWLARSRTPLLDCPSFDYRVPDGTHGWRLEPGARYRCQLPEATAEVAYDAAGWRDAAPSPSPPGARRVVVLGDSFMEAYSVDLEEAFHRRLVAEAAGAGLPLAARNLGVGGYGTLQAWLAFRDFGAPLAPDLVLLGFYPENDLANNSGELERLGTRGGTLKTTVRPFLAPGPEWRVTRGDLEQARRRFAKLRSPLRYAWRRLCDRSLVLDALRSRVKALRRSLDPPEPEALARREADGRLRRYGAYRCQEHPAFTRAWEATGRILARLRDDVAAAGGRLVVFTVPSLREVDRADRTLELHEVPRAEALCIEQAPANTRLRALAAELGVPLVDLLPEFRTAHRERGETLFHASDRHWNRAGHALAARDVFAALVDRGLLPASSAGPQSRR